MQLNKKLIGAIYIASYLPAPFVAVGSGLAAARYYESKLEDKIDSLSANTVGIGFTCGFLGLAAYMIPTTVVFAYCGLRRKVKANSSGI